MKATELMIGDWVYLNSNTEDRKGYYQIDFIHAGEIGIRGIGEYREVRTVTPPYIEPIPLTEEILKENGFRLVSYALDGVIYFYPVDKEPFWHETFTYNKQKDVVHWGSCTLRYVHELQHALRLCGLDDLADNFKIE